MKKNLNQYTAIKLGSFISHQWFWNWLIKAKWLVVPIQIQRNIYPNRHDFHDWKIALISSDWDNFYMKSIHLECQKFSTPCSIHLWSNILLDIVHCISWLGRFLHCGCSTLAGHYYLETFHRHQDMQFQLKMQRNIMITNKNIFP